MTHLLQVSHHHEHHEQELEEENVFITPKSIYLTPGEAEGVPEGFDAVRITLDGRIKADLSWVRQRDLAQNYIRQGLRIFWDIDLGLFEKLDQPLSSKPQFLSLSLSLEHFRDTLWKDFRPYTVGLCLYNGSLDFSHVFCSDACSEYLDLLSQCLPDTIPLYLMFDAAPVADRYRCAELLSKERYPRFNIAVKGTCGAAGQILGGDMEWAEGCLRPWPVERPCLGICLPNGSERSEAFRAAMEKLCADGVAFRVIPSGYLTAEWDGLDELIVDSKAVDKLLQRKLDGFRAAGGKIVYT